MVHQLKRMAVVQDTASIQRRKGGNTGTGSISSQNSAIQRVVPGQRDEAMEMGDELIFLEEAERMRDRG